MNSADSSAEERVNSIKNNFEQMIKSIRLLNSEVECLKQKHDQYVITLLQLQKETKAIQRISRTIKAKLEKEKHMEEEEQDLEETFQIVNDNKLNYVTENEFFKEMINYRVVPQSTNVELLYSVKTNSVVCAVSFDGTGDFFAYSNTKSVFLVNTIEGTLKDVFEIPGVEDNSNFNPRALKISPNSEYLVIPGPSDNIIVYSIPLKKIIGNLICHENKISSLLFSNDSQYLYSGGFDGKVCIWDLGSMTLVKVLQEEKIPHQNVNMVVALTKYNDDETLAIGFINGTVGISDMQLSQPLSYFSAHDEDQFLLDVCVSPLDGTIATTSHDKTTKIWALRGHASCKKTLHEHSDMVLSVCFSPTSTFCFTGSKDETFKGWNYKTGKLLFTMHAHKNTLFKIIHHPTENILATCSGDEHICLWKYNL